MAFDVMIRGKAFQVCRVNPQALQRLRALSFADDGLYHGNNPPDGWVQVGTGPKGGKIWGPPKKKEGAAKPEPKRRMTDEEEMAMLEAKISALPEKKEAKPEAKKEEPTKSTATVKVKEPEQKKTDAPAKSKEDEEIEAELAHQAKRREAASAGTIKERKPKELGKFDASKVPSDVHSHLMSSNEEWSAMLSKDETKALQNYAAGSYSAINKPLRSGGTVPKHLEKEVAALDKALDSNKTTAPMTASSKWFLKAKEAMAVSIWSSSW